MAQMLWRMLIEMIVYVCLSSRLTTSTADLQTMHPNFMSDVALASQKFSRSVDTQVAGTNESDHRNNISSYLAHHRCPISIRPGSRGEFKLCRKI